MSEGPANPQNEQFLLWVLLSPLSAELNLCCDPLGWHQWASNIEPRLKGILWLRSQAQTKARTPELWRQHHVIPWQPYTQLCTCRVEESLLE